MTINFFGSTSFPRLRRLRFSVRTGLRIDEHGYTRDITQLALDGVEIATMADRHAGRVVVLAIQFGFVGDEGNSLHAFGSH